MSTLPLRTSTQPSSTRVNPGRRRARRATMAALAAGAAVVLTVLVHATGAAAAQPTPTPGAARVPGTTPPSPPLTSPPVSSCPWLEEAEDRGESPSQLARLVVGRMTLDEKLGEIVLTDYRGYENLDSGVARLCIPRLTLQDGPEGLAYGDTNVTQLPIPLAIAATFDTSVAQRYGQVLGAETRGQGIDVLQGPDLNIDRVPWNGRSFEGFGEDPLLVSSMGVADIEGIQSQGVLAQAKHLAVYSQETNRGELDTVVSDRALQELYLPPFEAAVEQAHVGSAMCAYPQLNGVFQCQDPALVQQLDQWGFTGFVRSDLGAVHDPVAAIEAGTDLLKPSSVARLRRSVDLHLLPVTAVDAAVERVLTEMFAAGLVGRVQTGGPGTPVDSPAHTRFALQAAEHSAVLLKDRGAVLPLRSGPGTSLAVIGADGGAGPDSSGHGSAGVHAPFTSDPLAALRTRAGTRATVTYADGGSTTGSYPMIPSQYLTPSAGTGHGLTLTVAPTTPVAGTVPLEAVDPNVDVSLQAKPSVLAMTPPANANPEPDRPRGGLTGPLGPAVTRPRTTLTIPASWNQLTATWTGTLTPPATGLYAFSLTGSGGATLSLDGTPVVADPESHVHGVWSETATLTAGHPYAVTITWDPFNSDAVTGQTKLYPSSLSVGMEYATPAIDQAVATARSSSVALVFAGDYTAEGFDKPAPVLPGDENALIAAVAAANPRTVVVLNTGGPVVMPWAGQVAGVVEDWYPGEEDGAAIAAVLFGDVDPGGRLPVTFPASVSQTPMTSTAQWPGDGLVSTYSEGLDVGYRWYHATGTAPLYPFGYGLSYTTFHQHGLTVTPRGSGYDLRVQVTNTGSRSGTDVPQAYLTFPAAAGEPPAQLVAFAPVTVAPGHTTTVTLAVPATAFRSYQGSAWTTVPGTYTLAVGESADDLPQSATVTLP